MLRLIEPTSGDIHFEGKDVRSSGRTSFASLRRDIQIIFQDPYASLNPRMNVGAIVGEALIIHQLTKTRRQFEERVVDLLETVGLQADHMGRYPNEFSGGQRQRIGIARALAVEPKLIICDEPVSALDVSIQAQVINLLEDLQQKFGLAYLFIAHDLAVVEHISRSHRRDVSRAHRRDRAGPRTLCLAAASLHRGAVVGGADPRPESETAAHSGAGEVPSPISRQAAAVSTPAARSRSFRYAAASAAAETERRGALGTPAISAERTASVCPGGQCHCPPLRTKVRVRKGPPSAFDRGSRQAICFASLGCRGNENQTRTSHLGGSMKRRTLLAERSPSPIARCRPQALSLSSRRSKSA